MPFLPGRFKDVLTSAGSNSPIQLKYSIVKNARGGAYEDY